MNTELLNLVNDNYQEFLSLGSNLQGGEEHVEGTRVGLLGLQRYLCSIRDSIVQRRTEFAALLEEKREIGRRIRDGHTFTSVAEQVEDLEAELILPGSNRASQAALLAPHERFEGIDGDSDGFPDGEPPTHKLERQVEQYQVLMLLFQRHSGSTQFVARQAERIARIRSTLFIDVDSALKASRSDCADADHENAEAHLQSLLRAVTA